MFLAAFYFLIALFFRIVMLITWPLAYIGIIDPVVWAAAQVLYFDQLTTEAWDRK